MDDIIRVPTVLEVCPECGAPLYVEIEEWDTETGVPTPEGIHVHCSRDDYETSGHRYYQSYWQHVVDVVRVWVRGWHYRPNHTACSGMPIKLASADAER